MVIISTLQIEENKKYLIGGIICTGSRLMTLRLTHVNKLIKERDIRLLN